MSTDLEKKNKSSPPLDFDAGEEAMDLDEAMNASWGEVFHSCCVHTPQEWGMIFIGVCACAFFLYFFLLGLDVLGNGAKVMTGCGAGNLFGDDTNPVAGVMIGILATVLLQSSSTTTSIVVSLVGDDNAISVEQGIYMIMGANIGTSVTNTIVAMGQMGDGDELERAFAGATVHDLFNFATVAILLPVEVVTGYLNALTGAIVKNAEVKDGEKWTGPVKKIVGPLTSKIIKANKKVTQEIAQGKKTCEEYYPIVCEDGVVSKKTCKVALIACDSDTNKCPIFFSPDATKNDEVVAGAVCFVLAILLLFICLLGLVTVLKKMLLGVSSRVIYKATNLNGYVSMVIGALLTLLVQSSSITTSVLTPLVGVGVLPLEAMLPLTLGANIGTTMTALLASLVSDNIDSLQVALAHLFFNITGILIWYPIPFMRRVPLSGARFLGKMTRVWRGFPVLYIAIVFFLIPLYFLGLSSLFTQGTEGWTALGICLTLLTAFAIFYTVFWCKFRDGKQKMVVKFHNRQRKNDAISTLADDMDAMKRKLQILMDHTGAPADEDVEMGNFEMEDQALLKEENTGDDELSEIQT
ncbi:Sodium-dependent phosphate transport protein 2B [Seminavis robusta]|uniref:Sodium-dependent phosphate transport protein 2B n=1 Tax=Seminavis robusta TaxID=568900 RepID=A0A9N8HGP9_9STRA|nr:Sodium-dependent phosphate transport protein 2B [Seminavis robusta]|eukprot:Sro407_g136770.1 Sodium-dependent phosphate transport protein 2B (580) ;mRNA; r:60554-62580